MVFCATLLLLDSTWPVLKARTEKYQVPVCSAQMDVLVAAGSLICLTLVSADVLVPYSTLYPARLVSALPSVLVVGRAQLMVAEPLPQVQVSE